MAFLPPNTILEIGEKLNNGKELTKDESELLSAYSKSLKSSNSDSGIFPFLGGFFSGFFSGS